MSNSREEKFLDREIREVKNGDRGKRGRYEAEIEIKRSEWMKWEKEWNAINSDKINEVEEIWVNERKKRMTHYQFG